MSEVFWEVKEHVIPASHIRGFSRGVKDENTAHLRLAVKQYIPRTPEKHTRNGLTIIIAHGVGSSKESYGPILDDLLLLLRQSNTPVRAAWAMDVAHHGASYTLNARLLGDDPHWFDSSRDLLHMINHFQTQMPPPIVGIGQSWGCVTVSMLAAWHPRLFSAGIVCMEPMVGKLYDADVPGDDPAKVAVHRTAQRLVGRKDAWPSREAARKHLLANPYYKAFDPRVFEQVVTHDLRDLPPRDDGGGGDSGEAGPAVTLTTPKTQETYTILRPYPPLRHRNHDHDHDHNHHPSASGGNTLTVPGFARPERSIYIASLPHIRAPVLYVWGTLSGNARTEYAADIVRRTGSGGGGGGGRVGGIEGVKGGRVSEAFVEGAHHPVPLEKPREAAEAVAPWLAERFGTWEEEEGRTNGGPEFAVTEFPAEWKERVGRLGGKGSKL